MILFRRTSTLWQWAVNEILYRCFFQFRDNSLTILTCHIKLITFLTKCICYLSTSRNSMNLCSTKNMTVNNCMNTDFCKYVNMFSDSVVLASHIFKHHGNVETWRERTVCLRAVDAKEVIVAPQNAVAMLDFGFARHRPSIHARSMHVTQWTLCNSVTKHVHVYSHCPAPKSVFGCQKRIHHAHKYTWAILAGYSGDFSGRPYLTRTEYLQCSAWRHCLCRVTLILRPATLKISQPADFLPDILSWIFYAPFIPWYSTESQANICYLHHYNNTSARLDQQWGKYANWIKAEIKLKKSHNV